MIGLDRHIELPLYAFFKKLQAYDAQLNHQALGNDSYLDLVEILSKGYGIINKADLYLLCRTMWLKPYHQEANFKRLFQQHLAVEQQVAQKANKNKSIQDEEDKSAELLENTPSSPDEAIDTDMEEDMEESVPQEQLQKTVGLDFTSAAVAQNKYLTTDLASLEKDIYTHKFHLTGKFTTISPRRIEQGLRSLKVKQTHIAKKEIDFPTTIQRTSNQGYLDQLHYQFSAKNHTPVSLLIDQGGSMVAFFHLADLLKQKIQKANKTVSSLFYFRNCPIQKLYTNSEQTEGILLTELLPKNTNAMIILSDAGAARGGYHSARIKATQQFLKQCQHFPVIWLNPIPKHRWTQTSAAYIADFVPMYETNDLIFMNALKRLK